MNPHDPQRPPENSADRDPSPAADRARLERELDMLGASERELARDSGGTVDPETLVLVERTLREAMASADATMDRERHRRRRWIVTAAAAAVVGVALGWQFLTTAPVERDPRLMLGGKPRISRADFSGVEFEYLGGTGASFCITVLSGTEPNEILDRYRGVTSPRHSFDPARTARWPDSVLMTVGVEDPSGGEPLAESDPYSCSRR